MLKKLEHYKKLQLCPIPQFQGYILNLLQVLKTSSTSSFVAWEQEFKILNPKKNSRGNRKFTHKDIEAINKIYFLLKEKGYTIQGAKHCINNEKTSDKLDIVNKLKLIKDKLIEIRNQL